MVWIIKYHSAKLQSDLLDLPPGLLSRYLHCTDRMLIFGPDLGMPHTRALGQGLYELRLKSKKTEKTPLKERALASQRLKEWKHAHT